MTQEPLAQQLVALGRLLTEVETRLSKAPVAPVGLEDLKQSVDNLRTSMWAVLSVGHGVSAAARVERLKLRRALAGLQVIHEELDSGRKVVRHPEHAELQQLARTLADLIEKLP